MIVFFFFFSEMKGDIGRSGRTGPPGPKGNPVIIILSQQTFVSYFQQIHVDPCYKHLAET